MQLSKKIIDRREGNIQLISNNIVEDIQLSLNTNGYTNDTWAQKCGKEVKVYPEIRGVPVKDSTIATGFPHPAKDIFIKNTDFGILKLSKNTGILSVSSASITTSGYFYVPFTYFES